MFTFCQRTFQSKNIIFLLLDKCLYETEYLYLETLKEYVQNCYNITLFLTVTIKSIWIFSSPEPLGSLVSLWWVYSIAMVRRPSVHHFQRSSSPKLLGQSKPNFIWSLSGMGEQEFVHGVWGVTWPRWPPHPYMVKTLQKFSSPEPKGQWPCGLVCSIGPIIVCSNDDPRLTLTYFTAKSKLFSYAFIWVKLLKSFNGRNLQQMTRVTKGVCLYKNSDPKGLSAPAPGLYTCIKTWKIMYKIRLQRYFFETCNKWAKWQGFSVDIKILSTKGCLPLPRGYIHVEKH